MICEHCCWCAYACRRISSPSQMKMWLRSVLSDALPANIKDDQSAGGSGAEVRMPSTLVCRVRAAPGWPQLTAAAVLPCCRRSSGRVIAMESQMARKTRRVWSCHSSPTPLPASQLHWLLKGLRATVSMAASAGLKATFGGFGCACSQTATQRVLRNLRCVCLTLAACLHTI